MKKIPTPAILLSALVLAFVSLSPMAGASHGSPEVASALAAPVTEPSGLPRLASADLGFSGRLRAILGTPATLEEDPILKPLVASNEGAWPMVSTAEGDSITVVTLVPIEDADQAGYGRYHVGSWPQDTMTAAAARYTPPRGFIGVTEQNQATKLSQSFAVRDFLTHDQGNVWPKVLVLQSRILDKLELLRAELDREGLPSQLHVMSGFRTPQYNAQGVGKGGRATHSRHMYGDAADVFVDADGNGWMDDLNGDGKVDVADARVLRAAAERVEAQYPTLVGGLSAYPSNGVHGPFVHVDARGVKARW
jgi:hypothetical protein